MTRATAHASSWLARAARWMEDEDLLLRCGIALSVSLAALVTLVAIAHDFTHRGALTRFDVSVMITFHRDATPGGTRVFELVTLLGAPITVTIVGLLVAALLLARRRSTLAAGLLATLLGGGIINEGLKYTIRRHRPPYAAAHLSHLTFSFPSGHVVGSFVGYGMLAYLVLLWIPRRGIAVLVVVATVALMLAIGISRLYLGVHYLSDVAGGYAAGACWLSISVTVMDTWYRRSLRHRARVSAADASAS